MTILDLEHYSIYVGNIWPSFNEWLDQKDYSSTFIIVDENTKQHCLPLLLEHSNITNYHLIEIQSGETHKNIQSCTQIWQAMMGANADRRALTINLGGGVIGDMGGFCASTFKRGMDFIQMPTTLLSQVDASIGGKLGIDFAEVKNSVGLFQDPKAVFIQPDFLQTLSPREIRSGYAELIKHSLIADAEQWTILSALPNLEGVDWPALISPSLRIKQGVVEADPFERGWRKVLNFGHTIGHAVESIALSSPSPLLHGEAIAIGMICELYLSHLYLELALSDVEKITKYLLQLYGKYELDAKDDALLALMQQDKKNEGGAINFTLIESIGQGKVNLTCTNEHIKEALDFYRQQ